jgi:hypothetical protein
MQQTWTGVSKKVQISPVHSITTEKPQRGDINIAWGSALGNPSYAHVEYNQKLEMTY